MAPRRDEEQARAAVEATYRQESRRVLATLLRLLGDFDRAEEALHEAFAAALERWPREGLPRAPRAWLISVGRFRAIDALRRRARLDASLARLADRLEREPAPAPDLEDLPDERLRLILACCHPALSSEAQLALTLREACGLTTEEVARACLVRAPTLAQRIVRAKARLREARAGFELPGRQELPARLHAALRVVYLVFNEGYSAAAGASLLRVDLCAEALRLGRLLIEQLPDEPEAQGLLALMLLHDARRAARSTATGDLVLLDEQDRARWDRARIAEGCALVEAALRSRRFGPYTLQAAIAAVHCEAPSAAATDWRQIVGLYDLLLRVEPSPVIALNRAVALAQRDGPAAGLAEVDALLARGELQDYPLTHATRADLCEQLGRTSEARAAWSRALELSRQEPERRHFRARLAGLGGEG
ncbi:MAG: RNA polymerase sigma factor [Planctomycetota bacterium]